MKRLSGEKVQILQLIFINEIFIVFFLKEIKKILIKHMCQAHI